MMSRPPFPDAGRGLPRVAFGDPAAGARLLADMLPRAIAKAEAVGAVEAAAHLRAALAVAERRSAAGGRDRAKSLS